MPNSDQNRGIADLPLFAAGPQTPLDGPTTREAKTAAKRLTVSELTARIRGVIEPSFPQVWVQGEVSNYRPAASGHAYFSLKDASSNLSAASFGWGARKRAFDLK